MVEHQQLINWLILVAGGSIGWIMKLLYDAVTGLKNNMRQIERDLPEIYVRKDDFKAAMMDVKSDMRELRQDMKEGFASVDRGITMVFKRIDEQRRDIDKRGD